VAERTESEVKEVGKAEKVKKGKQGYNDRKN